MGMYTEIYVNMDFRPDTPKEIVELLFAICNQDFDYMEKNGYPERFACLFCDMSCYTPQTNTSQITIPGDCRTTMSLLGKGDIKNYDNEIEKFFEIVAPWCDNEGRMIGYAHYEEHKDPYIFFYANGEWD